MLQLIKRSPDYLSGYREYCKELYESGALYFRPTNPARIDDDWFSRTKSWYDDKENGLVKGQPMGFHYWAVDDGKFIGEFQLRTEFTDIVMQDIGSIGYAVRTSERGKGYGKEILRQGLDIARERGMERVLLIINESNAVSIHICEKAGGRLQDTIVTENDVERRSLRRYLIELQ